MQFDIDMESEYKPLFITVRKILIEDFQLKETKKQRITTYSNENGGICHMRTMPDGIDIGFLKGVLLEDKDCLLTGKGKVMRVLPICDLKIDQVQYYIKQAIVVNKK